jgi:hypothetical protein
MPRADQTSQVEPPGVAAVDASRDLSHEETLAAALSSFLSQLNLCLDIPRLDETVDVTDATGAGGRVAAGPPPLPPAFPPIARSQGLKRALPSGALGGPLFDAPAAPTAGPVAAPAFGPVVARVIGPEPEAPRPAAPQAAEQSDILPRGSDISPHWPHKSTVRAEVKPGEARSLRRPLWAGVVAVAVLTAAGLAVTLAWERGERSALDQRTQQLAAVESTLATTQANLSAQGRRTVALEADLRNIAKEWGTVKGQLVQVQNDLNTTKGELNKAQQQLSKAQAQVGQAQSRAGQAQSRAGQAQSRAGQAQSQLSHTQLNLSTTQSHATLCQQGASLGQQTAQLLTSLIFLENAYFTAAQSKDTARMRADLARMQGLDVQAEALGPKFTASAQLCTTGR